MSDSAFASDATSDKYVVVARRYRPKSFGELVGQGHVGRALKNAIETNRVGHAYLFTGARGVGKTSTARIFAKALNAPEGPTATPDNDTDIAQAIDAGEDVDVLEIDGASNRGIDEIRALRAGANVLPSRSRYKIYIIDEVHMLTKEAFNALLKTLEEPPSHVKFIFCTTDPEKIPITVLSRCQRFDFSPVQTTEIIGRLREIVDAENVTADDEALRLIARRAAGSMRDSQSLLEQVLSFSSGELNVETVHSLLGTASDERLRELTAALIAHDAKSALEQADAAIMAGVDAGQLGEQLLGYFRDLLVATIGCDATMLRFCSESMHDELKTLGETWGVATILAVVSLLDQTLVRIGHSVHGRVLLEAALVQVCRLPDLQRMSDIIAGIDASRPAVAEKKKAEPLANRSVPSSVAATANGPRPTPAPSNAVASIPPKPHFSSAATSASATSASATSAAAASASATSSVSTPPQISPGTRSSNSAPQNATDSAAEAKETVVVSTVAADTKPAEAAESGDAETKKLPESYPPPEWTAEGVAQLWSRAVERLDDLTADLARQFSRIEPIEPGRIRVLFPADLQLTKSRCEKPEQKTKLEGALQVVAARNVQIELAFDPHAVSKPIVMPASNSTQRRQKQRELQTHPLVQKCIEVFDAEVIRVDEPRT